MAVVVVLLLLPLMTMKNLYTYSHKICICMRAMFDIVSRYVCGAMHKWHPPSIIRHDNFIHQTNACVYHKQSYKVWNETVDRSATDSIFIVQTQTTIAHARRTHVTQHTHDLHTSTTGYPKMNYCRAIFSDEYNFFTLIIMLEEVFDELSTMILIRSSSCVLWPIIV